MQTDVTGLGSLDVIDVMELRQAKALNSFKSRLKTYLFQKYFYSL